MTNAPEYIAGLKVLTTVVHVYEAGTADEWSKAYYLLDRGVLVAVDVELGQRIQLGFGVVLEHGCTIGSDVAIDDLTRIGDHAVIGNRVRIGKRCVIEHECGVGSDSTVGDESYLGAGNYLPWSTRMADHVLVTYETLEDGDAARGAVAESSTVVVDQGGMFSVYRRTR